jgi:hypothetical protein
MSKSSLCGSACDLMSPALGEEGWTWHWKVLSTELLSATETFVATEAALADEEMVSLVAKAI